MTKTDSITIELHPWSGIARFLIFWTTLIAAEWVTRLGFGGSFLVDVIIFFCILVGFGTWIRRTSGQSVTMSRSELRAWVNDGAPYDVLEWRAACNAKVVTGMRVNS